MSGGFCSNCHEEVFIAEQYSELGQDVPESIAKKASEQIDDPDRIDMVDRMRKSESKRIREKYFEMFGEYPKN